MCHHDANRSKMKILYSYELKTLGFRKWHFAQTQTWWFKGGSIQSTTKKATCESTNIYIIEINWLYYQKKFVFYGI